MTPKTFFMTTWQSRKQRRQPCESPHELVEEPRPPSLALDCLAQPQGAQVGKSLTILRVALLAGGDADHVNPPSSQHDHWRPIDQSYTSTNFTLAQTLKRLWSADYSGWRLGASIGFWSSLLTLVCNMALLGVGISRREYGSIGVLSQGTPQQMSSISMLFHVLINVQSTILLSASNYCMQVLTAPTRVEIDIAHRGGHYLDIGVLSLHNLRHISRQRSTLFWLLLVSSLPLHLFYNSVISTVVSSREVEVTILTDQNETEINSMMDAGYRQLTNAQWPSSQSSQSAYGNLYLVTDRVMCGVVMDANNGRLNFSTILEAEREASGYNATGTFQFSWPQYNQYRSELPAFTLPYPILVDRTSESVTDALSLTPDNWIDLHDLQLRVSGAFTMVSNKGSKVQLMIAFMALVVVCNGGKTAVMGFMIYSKTFRDPLVTGGDAISSFVQIPEAKSVGYCISEQEDVLKAWADGQDDSTISSKSRADKTQAWHESKFRLCKAVSRRRANGFLLNYLVVACLIAAALIVAFCSPAQENRWAWGTSSELTVNFGASGVDAKSVLFNTWLTNLPQVFLSAVYFTFNGLLTLMYSAYEWNQWGEQRKHLRLPYKVAIPMTVNSGFLHWLLSQCFFLRRIEFYDAHENLQGESLNTCGYSPLSLLVFALCALVGTIVVALMSLKSFEQKIPLGANSSIIISAACHPPPDDVDAHLKPIQWGVVQSRYVGVGDESVVQHCSFTSEVVARPEIGRQYA